VVIDDDLGAFTAEQVMRLTGISRRKLTYWLENGILAADVDAARGRGHVRLFSFRNLVEVRVALWLRDKVSLQLIRKIVRRLRTGGGPDQPLAELRFAVIEDRSGRRPPRHEVIVQGPDGAWEQARSGQKVMEITVPVRQFAEELREAAAKDRRRRRRTGQVERRRGVLGSATVLAGTRVPTKAIRSLRDAGYSVDRILRNYPGLTRKDVAAALADEPRRRRKGA
jgi:DNA-binding transcriptional MerR regulator